jgi:hypothetical protein
MLAGKTVTNPIDLDSRLIAANSYQSSTSESITYAGIQNVAGTLLGRQVLLRFHATTMRGSTPI